jgi:hypothetical protein
VILAVILPPSGFARFAYLSLESVLFFLLLDERRLTGKRQTENTPLSGSSLSERIDSNKVVTG